MIAPIPCLFSEYPVPLPVSGCCFVIEVPDGRPLRETSVMRQGAESLTCFCGAGVARLLSGEAKSNVSPNTAFMLIPPHRARLTDLLLLVKVQFGAKLAHKPKQGLLSGNQPRTSPGGPQL